MATLIDVSGENFLQGGPFDSLSGLGGNDTLIGSFGDTIDGGDGNDRISPNGPTTIIGGAGQDTIYLPPVHIGVTEADAILVTDFVPGAGGDILDFADLLRPIRDLGVDLGNPFGPAGYLRLVAQQGDTIVQWDEDGGGDRYVPLVILKGVATSALTQANLGYDPQGTSLAGLFLNGTAAAEALLGGLGNDTILGLSGNDTLDGGAAGADSLDGGTGSDSLYGRSGDDTLLGNDGDDVILGGTGTDSMDGGSGNDIIFASSSGTVRGGMGDDQIGQTFTSPGGVILVHGDDGNDVIECFPGQGGDATLSGGDGTDLIIAADDGHYLLQGDAGADTLTGGTSDDTLDGGTGDDVMSGGAGNDTYVVDGAGDTVTELPGDGIDTIRSSISLNLMAGVENLMLTAGATAGFGVGNELGNQITGNDSGNSLYGQGGDDTLTGGAGADYIYGGVGNDSVAGGGGIDLLIGEAGNDTLDGGSSPAGFGNVLLGGAGSDTYIVHSGLDLVDEGNIPAYAAYGFGGFDTIVSTANFYWDVYSVAERVVIAEGADDPNGTGTTAVGSIFGNEMIGNSGNNVLFGRGGSDTYRAGDGIDFISLSTLGVTDIGNYVARGDNTIIVDPRQSGAVSYDIVFEFNPTKDKVDVSAYRYANAATVIAKAVDDGAGSTYISLGDGLDYLYLVGISKAQLLESDFIV
ncbi:calcium-binding protein [Belnapia sp. F-4-1]|uniref:calcium-binding protein n=1 Tax=Belnapia sp. F-4-1 TaxID=1545443 RepID=UPI0005B97F2F|nr:calcium-binding protein [Belnapia sp. F-4-1]